MVIYIILPSFTAIIHSHSNLIKGSSNIPPSTVNYINDRRTFSATNFKGLNDKRSFCQKPYATSKGLKRYFSTLRELRGFY